MTAVASVPITIGSVQPSDGASCKAKVKPTAATTEVAAPMTSNLPVAAVRELGTARTPITSEVAVNRIGSTNNHRQDARSTSSAEMYIPMIPPPPATAVHIPIARDRASSGNDDVI